MSAASVQRVIRAIVVGVALLLVAAVWLFRVRQNAVHRVESTKREATPSAASAPAVPSAPTASGSRLLGRAGGPVYLRLNEIRLVRPGAALRGRLRANVNGAYYDYPSEPGDAGPAFFEVGSPTHGKYFEIPRSVLYEVYFELALGHGRTVSGASETLNLTSSSGALSDKVPYSEEYKLYFTGHGARAHDPTAIVSFTITEAP